MRFIAGTDINEEQLKAAAKQLGKQLIVKRARLTKTV
jgi:hypothetical protein